MQNLVLPLYVLEKAQSCIGMSVTNIQPVSRLVFSCRDSFKIIIFPIGSVSDLFSSKYISPSGKRICGCHGFQESLTLSGELGQIRRVKMYIAQ